MSIKLNTKQKVKSNKKALDRCRYYSTGLRFSLLLRSVKKGISIVEEDLDQSRPELRYNADVLTSDMKDLLEILNSLK